MTLNNYFDKIYCINMNHRKDRWDRCNEIFTLLKIDVERVSGITGPAGGWLSDMYPHPIRGFVGMTGCIQTHLNILQEASESDYKKILILEDDCEFINDFMDVFEKQMKDLPLYWDMLYLGGIHQPGIPSPVVVNKSVVRVFNMLTSHSIAYRVPVCKKIVQHIMNDWPYLKNSVDGYFTTLQGIFNVYAFINPLTWQRGSHSDVQNGYRNYEKQFKKRLV